jgi:nucleotide-binding universal stress UspA family protein
VGLGVVDEPTICRREPVPMGAAAYKHERDQQLLEEARRIVESFLASFASQCAAAGVQHKILEDVGTPYKEILRESHRYDLVLLGHETHFHFETEEQADETLWRVLRREGRPVVIAPASLRGGESVVVAYNGSPQADRALQAFQASGLDMKEEVHVLCAGADPQDAGAKAEEGAAFLRSHGIQALASGRQPAGSVAQTILHEVRDRNARLLVMGALGHSTLREVLLGSVTKNVLRSSAVPVFVCD